MPEYTSEYTTVKELIDCSEKKIETLTWMLEDADIDNAYLTSEYSRLYNIVQQIKTRLFIIRDGYESPLLAVEEIEDILKTWDE